MRDSENQILTIQELSEVLKVKVSHLRALVFKKAIPSFRIGKLVRFEKKEILLWLKENSIQKSNNY